MSLLYGLLTFLSISEWKRRLENNALCILNPKINSKTNYYITGKKKQHSFIIITFSNRRGEKIQNSRIPKTAETTSNNSILAIHVAPAAADDGNNITTRSTHRATKISIHLNSSIYIIRAVDISFFCVFAIGRYDI